LAELLHQRAAGGVDVVMVDGEVRRAPGVEASGEVAVAVVEEGPGEEGVVRHALSLAGLEWSVLYVAPLCPAGHLPYRWGDWPSQTVSPIVDVAGWPNPQRQPISPLVGEMSGRTAGGAVPPTYP